MAVATSFTVPNFSGMLFQKGKSATPFSTMIGSRPLYTNHVEFVTGQYYDVETGEQPAISETASLTAPDPDVTTRQQLTNVTQIFHKTLAVSYGKESNMGTLSGVNIAGQQANPQSELAFQASRRMAKIAQDIEYTFLNGQYQKASNDSTPNKTRGLLTAITTNVLDLDGQPLSYWLVAEGLRSIHEQGGVTDNIVLGVDALTLLQLNYDAQKNGLTIVPAGREVNGLRIMTVVTPLGEVAVALMDSLPTSTAALFDPTIMSPVFQPVPGKGNFFMEELSKVGAGTTYQIFGQVGLDHGPEWMSAKFTNISVDPPSTLSGIAGSLKSLSVNSVASESTVGKTKVTVTPEKEGDNSYKYKTGASLTMPIYNQVCQAGYTNWNGSDEIEAETGKKILVVEVDSSNRAKGAGEATVTSKEE